MTRVLRQSVSREQEAVRQFGRIAAAVAVSMAAIGVMYYFVLYIISE